MSSPDKKAEASDYSVPFGVSETKLEPPYEMVGSSTKGDDAERNEERDKEQDYVSKFGAIEYEYINRPKELLWFTMPHALNYFKDGVLYRTKGERTAAKTELFLDLLYVGIIANLAGDASEHASGAALLKYVLMFFPAWMVWSDIKDFTNYYYNEDLSQRLYIFWILSLLTFFVNSQTEVLVSVKGAACTIVPYMLCRLSLAASLFLYSFYIPEHRPQMRLGVVLLVITSSLWIPVIFVGTRAKIGISFCVLSLEHLSMMLVYHPVTIKLLKVKARTALNIEHEVERFSAFVTIAVGEFLYKVVANNPLGAGFSAKYARGILLLWIAYILFWLYQHGSTSRKTVHALRHSVPTAIGWIYCHVPLVAALVLAADAGGDIMAMETVRLTKPSSTTEGELLGRMVLIVRETAETEQKHLYALSFYLTGGICVCLISMFLIAMFEKEIDPPGTFKVPKFWRIIWRVPVGITIACLSFAELQSTLLFGLIAALMSILFLFESITSTPKEAA